MNWLYVFIFLIPLPLVAANQQKKCIVPTVVHFADLRIHLTSDARKRIQAKVNSLTRCEKGLEKLLDRTHLFFPIIEQTLASENTPDDFKYLALHESTLVGNAVSYTNDVGFWQIQKATALGLKLSVNQHVDERMHLIESTKAAARFLKDHNQYFKSWLGAMLAYNRGRGGAAKIFPKRFYGAKRVCLDAKTDNYILCVLANKIAFQHTAGKKRHPKLQLFLYKKGHHGKRLGDIATHLKVEEKLLKEHNLWLKTTTIPHTATCSLVVPFLHTHAVKPPLLVPKAYKSLPKKTYNHTNKTTKSFSNQKLLKTPHVDYAKRLVSQKKFPAITPLKDARSVRLIKANGKLAIIAQKGDTIESLAKLLRWSQKKFMLVNEIEQTHKLVPGKVYYYQSKDSKAAVHYHVVKAEENIWGIAQAYGIKVAALLKKNRIKEEKRSLEVGQILWLRFIRPVRIPVAYHNPHSGA